MEDDENIDDEGVKINESDFPLLNLFKIINGGILFIVFLLAGFVNSMMWTILLTISFVLGFTSLFLPAKRSNIRNFSILTFGLCIGPLAALVANST